MGNFADSPPRNGEVESRKADTGTRISAVANRKPTKTIATLPVVVVFVIINIDFTRNNFEKLSSLLLLKIIVSLQL
jgi:hypothetical protein